MAREAGGLDKRRIWHAGGEATLKAVLSRPHLERSIDRLRGRSVLIASESQFASTLAIVACDGIARRIILLPPGVPEGHLRAIAAEAQVDAVICDDPLFANPLPHVEAFAVSQSMGGSSTGDLSKATDQPCTEWVLLTSGTAGPPKMAVHTLRTLAGAIQDSSLGAGAVWSTWYDIRRYGGLQILLRALIGGGSMILADPAETTGAFLARADDCGVTHISGTPSHWRRALMAMPGLAFAPGYIRLSGEIADQATLDRLHTAFPAAKISHAFASTEAGVAFDVTDGRAGFPAELIGRDGEVALRVHDGSLRIRSDRTALHYLGNAAEALHDADGFVDTGDMLELRGGRYHFIGRRSGIINVGGFKIHPEEVEEVIAQHPRVRGCRVRARRNPITGSIVVAEVVADRVNADRAHSRNLEDEIIAFCRPRLPPHKMPAMIRFVPTLAVGVSGKMGR